MKKFKLTLSAFTLALALIFVSAGSITAYANADDPQGTVEKKPAPSAPAPPPDIFSYIWALLSLL
jgi:hypothetical protein